jgi:hypothetical protein
MVIPCTARLAMGSLPHLHQLLISKIDWLINLEIMEP